MEFEYFCKIDKIRKIELVFSFCVYFGIKLVLEIVDVTLQGNKIVDGTET